ncbi:hypothetical protein [Streptomyces sp. ADI95-17]|nr:hypothetical protein [Streptomyces sp. ADI95-17]
MNSSLVNGLPALGAVEVIVIVVVLVFRLARHVRADVRFQFGR